LSEPLEEVPDGATPARSDLHNASLLYAATIASQVLTAAVYLLCARSSTPEELGNAAAAVSVIAVCVGVVDFGGAAYTIREMAALRMTAGMFRRWLLSKSVVVFASALVVAGVTAAMGSSNRWATGSSTWIYFSAWSLALVASVPLRANMKFAQLSAMLAISRVPSALAAVWLFTTGHLGSEFLIPLLAATSLLELALYIASAAFAEVRNDVARSRWHPVNPFRATWRIGINATVNSFASLDTVVVREASGSASAGQFSAVSKWIGPIGLVSNAISQAFFPRLSSTSRSDRARVLRSALIPIALSLPILLLIALNSEHIVRVLIGPGYPDSGTVLAVLCAGMGFALFNQPLNGALVAWRLERAATISLAVGIGSQLVAQFFFSAAVGSVGGAWGFLVGQTITTAALTVAILVQRSTWSRLDAELPGVRA